MSDQNYNNYQFTLRFLYNAGGGILLAAVVLLGWLCTYSDVRGAVVSYIHAHTPCR